MEYMQVIQWNIKLPDEANIMKWVCDKYDITEL
jgi:hypothetical protein